MGGHQPTGVNNSKFLGLHLQKFSALASINIGDLPLLHTQEYAVGSVEPVDAGGLAAQDAGTHEQQGRDETDGADSDPLHHTWHRHR